MDFQGIINDVSKWFRIRKNMYGVLAWIAIVFLLAGDFSYWAGAIEVADKTTDTGSDDDDDKIIPEGNFTVVFEKLPPVSGSFPVGRPQTQNDAAQHPFEVKADACIGWVNLTGSGVGRPDIDLYIMDPKGKVQASAATPEASESAIIKEKNFNRGGPGTWIAVVDPYSGFNLEYTLDITIGYKAYDNASCEDDICYD